MAMYPWDLAIEDGEVSVWLHSKLTVDGYLEALGIQDTPLGDITPSSAQVTDLTIHGEVLADVDFGGNYAKDLQNVQDIIAGKGAGYWFDGVDDYINVGDGTESNFILDNDLSIISLFAPAEIKGQAFCSFGGLGSSSSVVLGMNSSGRLLTTNYGATSIIDTQEIVEANKRYVGAVVYDKSITTAQLYLNGITLDSGVIDVTTITGNAYIGKLISNESYFHGEIFGTFLFNLALSNLEIKAISSGAPVPYKYIGASQTALTSGTLTIGKQYIIDTFVAGDDFVNVGGTNVTGSSFEATAVTPTTWANGSSLRQLGCVLQDEPDGITEDTWFDKSGNELDGTVSGAIATNSSKSTFLCTKRLSSSAIAGPPTNPPTRATYGITPALEFTVGTDHIGYKAHIPQDYVPGSDVLLYLHWTKSTVGTDQSSKYAKWQLQYLPFEEDDNINSGESTLSIEQEYDSAVVATQIDIVTTAYTIPAAEISAGDTISLDLMAIAPAGAALTDEPAALALDIAIRRYSNHE